MQRATRTQKMSNAPNLRFVKQYKFNTRVMMDQSTLLKTGKDEDKTAVYIYRTSAPSPNTYNSQFDNVLSVMLASSGTVLSIDAFFNSQNDLLEVQDQSYTSRLV